MNIINETIYDNDLINEAGDVLSKKYKCIVAGCAAFFLAMACFYGLVLRASVTAVVIPIVGIIVVLVIGVIKVTSYKKMMVQKLKTVNHDDRVMCTYEIDDEKILVKSANGMTTLYHKDIKKIKETKKSFFVIYAGGVFSAISKAGFKDNSENEFRRFLKI